METVGIGMIGSGYMGRTYAESISKYNEGGRLVAVHGGSRAPGLAEDYGIDVEPSLESLLFRPDVDAVIVASPHQVHAEQVIAAADQGKHVLVEKPMATNVADCDAMIAACDDAGVTLSVIQTLRYRGVFSRAKKLIDEGRIGTVRMSQLTSLWTWYHETKSWLDEPESGGSFLDRGAHVCDMLRWLTGDEASSRLRVGRVDQGRSVEGDERDDPDTVRRRGRRAVVDEPRAAGARLPEQPGISRESTATRASSRRTASGC